MIVQVENSIPCTKLVKLLYEISITFRLWGRELAWLVSDESLFQISDYQLLIVSSHGKKEAKDLPGVPLMKSTNPAHQGSDPKIRSLPKGFIS
jgi:hypothetical protein